jgi:hypothetical protein
VEIPSHASVSRFTQPIVALPRWYEVLSKTIFSLTDFAIRGRRIRKHFASNTTVGLSGGYDGEGQKHAEKSEGVDH